MEFSKQELLQAAREALESQTTKEARGHENGDCWVWHRPGSTHRVVHFQGRSKDASKTSATIAAGFPPPPRVRIARKCGFEDCVNPLHLLLKDGAQEFSSKKHLKTAEEALKKKVRGHRLGSDVCWLWPKPSSVHRVVDVEGKPRDALRIASTVAAKFVVPPDFGVEHRCGRKECLNPRHLTFVKKATKRSGKQTPESK